MLNRRRFALNRIACPSLDLPAFFKLAVDLDLSKVELRNDLPGKLGAAGIIDGLKPSEAAKMAKDNGVSIIAINALQKFNLASVRKSALKELNSLLSLSAEIGCKAIILCPNNDEADARSPDVRYAETVDALRQFGPAFVKFGILGYVEPLGFGISSLASLTVAMNAVKESGYGCFRLVHDTFHHYIGPDDASIYGANGLGAPYEVAYTGLVHISGVEADIAPDAYRDAHRVLVGPKDRMKNRDQIRRLDSLGYMGDYSFEPFSESIQKMDARRLSAEINASIDFMIGE
ncbi:MAG: xylose isomerase [Treponema sp. GWB1_62_6]|nr:MAG: xylose isomerase [Treponema sp. GWA1_62_8]OHE66666.1 MAG: xylose isomerase [Treponema sp. GWC1_61_84]OHE70993.1 MAG: xylose isomerase [Treponema sp. GWB1_62_6]OHE74487.1 MAG: xylose isomerase [Treponema sp. RIFOXYC1_FULL_61_9]HCM25668.1 xylose isomerase [Treponema sp.]